MKKTLIALAAVAVSSAAMAQVTVSGGYGVAYQSYDVAAVAAKAAGTANLTGIGTLGAAATAAVPAKSEKGLAMTDSSVRFTASEDIGGGMRASGFVQFSANDVRGGNITKEDSNLSLSGGFGSITIANTRSSQAAIAANVFASAMPVTSIYASTDSRAPIDTVTYTTPELTKGLRVSVTQIETTQTGVTSAGKVNMVSANYNAGPLAVNVAHKMYNAALVGAEDRTEGAVTYDLGVAKVGLGYGTKTTATGDEGVYYGVSVPMGAITIGVNGGMRGDAEFMDAGAAYALSKRTTINAMFGSRNTGAAGAADLDQYRVGIFHSF
jgi:hypothetical protein